MVARMVSIEFFLEKRGEDIRNAAGLRQPSSGIQRRSDVDHRVLVGILKESQPILLARANEEAPRVNDTPLGLAGFRNAAFSLGDRA